MSARRLLGGVGLVSLVGFVATFALALHTARGRAADRAALERLSGERLPVIQRFGDHALGLIDVGTIAVAIVVLVLVAVLRGEVRRAGAAAAAAGLTIATAELLKHELPLAGAIPAGRPPTFPSGHTAVAVGLGLALVLAVPPLLRPAAAVAAGAYAASIAYFVVALGWHYPSDSIGAFFIGGFWTAAVGLTLRTSARPRVSVGGVVFGICGIAAGLALAAAVASRHTAAVAAARERPLLLVAAAAYGLLSLLLYLVVTPLVSENGR